MRDEIYQLESTPSLMSYEFVSEGPKGHITKVVKYTETEVKDVYNLGFGDKIGDSDDIDDKVVSDNKDSLRILATVAETVYRFTDMYPDAYIYATGSTSTRTRLYCIGISNYLEEIEKGFKVFGVINGLIEKFARNRNYEAFLIKRKVI
jgi:hypothetical protein